MTSIQQISMSLSTYACIHTSIYMAMISYVHTYFGNGPGSGCHLDAWKTWEQNPALKISASPPPHPKKHPRTHSCRPHQPALTISYASFLGKNARQFLASLFIFGCQCVLLYRNVYELWTYECMCRSVYTLKKSFKCTLISPLADVFSSFLCHPTAIVDSTPKTSCIWESKKRYHKNSFILV